MGEAVLLDCDIHDVRCDVKKPEDTRFAKVIDSAMDAIVLADSRNRITVFNPAAQKVFRCTAAEAIGKPINKLLPARFHEAHGKHMREYARSGATTRTMHLPGVVTGLRADGEEFPAEATISAGEANGEPFYAVILRDITQRLRAEEILRKAENAQVTETVKRYQIERSIASGIQQRLFTSQMPSVPFATVQARNIACADIGGDFYDVIALPGKLAIVIADSSAKGISAALQASILQGIIHSQLLSDTPLHKLAEVINRFLCARGLGYATAIILYLTAGGELELVNCGHIRPLLVSGDVIAPLEDANLPVGFFPDVVYQSARCRLRTGDRLLLVSDGVTEAEDGGGNCFGGQRLNQLAAAGAVPAEILAAMRTFCENKPLADDCTVLTVTFLG